MQNQNPNEVAGYTLFNDVEDVALRINNQAQTLRNIMEDNRVGDQFTTRAMAITAKYFMSIDKEYRKAVHDRLSVLFNTKVSA